MLAVQIAAYSSRLADILGRMVGNPETIPEVTN